MRQKFVIGNWKMYTTAAEAKHLAQAVVAGMSLENNVTFAVCPPFPYLALVGESAIIRHRFSQMFGARSAQTLAVHYGGSVKPENADAVLSRPGVDGVLIGGDSLHAEPFLAIVRAAIRQTQTPVAAA